MRILALEVGTCAVKSAIVEAHSAEIVGKIGRAELHLDRPTSEAAEVPAARVWQAVTAAARQVTRRTDGIEGVGLSCISPTLVLLDQTDQPLRSLWTPLDRRARQAARQVQAAVGEEFLATVGARPLPGLISALWYRQMSDEDPYLPTKVKSFLSLNGWLTLRMTGERASDRGNASYTGLFNTVGTQDWSRRWCDFFEVDHDWLPPLVCASATLGSLRSAVAAELGLPPGLPVKIGTTSINSALLAGRIAVGELLHLVDSTQVLATIAVQARPEASRVTAMLGLGTATVHISFNPVGGEALTWMHQLCFREQDEATFHTATIPEALHRPTRVSLAPPHLGGDPLEIEAHRAAFRDLTFATERMDVLAAVIQSMRRQHWRALTGLGQGEDYGRICLSGTSAEVVQRLLPDYADKKVERIVEAGLCGVGRLFTT